MSGISNEEMKDIMKIVKSLKHSGLLIKDVSETIKNEAKEQKGGFLGILSTLGVGLFGNILAGNVVARASAEVIAKRQGQGTIRAVQDF